MSLRIPSSDAAVPTASWVPILRLGLAAAACWHLLGNAGLSTGPASVLLGVAAASVVLWPRSPVPLAGLSMAIWWSIWQEAPQLGNHWLLAGLVTAAATLGSFSRDREGPAAAARAVVLVFYAFAAFAKLNAGFFDPETSCATFYFAESARSLGFDVTPPVGAPGTALAIGVAVAELSIPVLLVWRRTRVVGVAFAVAFHAILAIDHRHQFYDFTTLLVAVFVTFLPVGVAAEWTSALTRRVRPRSLQVGAAVLAVTAGALAAQRSSIDTAFELGYAAWVAAAVLVVPAVWLAAWRHRADDPSDLPRVVSVPALAIPVVFIALLNGLTPYIELKTSTSWNMYANLRTVDGDSNHFLIRSTFPIGDAQADLVEVLESDGPLQRYVDEGQLLPRRQVRWYLQHHPEEAAELLVGGQPVEVVPGSIPPELGGHVPEVVGRLAALRASVPEGEPNPCQPAFLPAT